MYIGFEKWSTDESDSIGRYDAMSVFLTERKVLTGY